LEDKSVYDTIRSSTINLLIVIYIPPSDPGAIVPSNPSLNFEQALVKWWERLTIRLLLQIRDFGSTKHVFDVSIRGRRIKKDRPMDASHTSPMILLFEEGTITPFQNNDN
jgi:hypothetical protein